MTINEPIWCSFCEDRPAVGQMIVMQDKSRIEISAVPGTDGVACDLHGRAWTGVPVASHDGTGEFAVLQYVHPEFENVTETHIVEFAGEKTCSECGDPTEAMPLWVAERILRAHPQLVLSDEYRWEGICVECAENNACPHCADDDEHDDGGGDEGWNTHPYH